MNEIVNEVHRIREQTGGMVLTMSQAARYLGIKELDFLTLLLHEEIPALPRLYKVKAVDVANYIWGASNGKNDLVANPALDTAAAPALQSPQILKEDCNMNLNHGEGSIYQDSTGTWKCAFYYREDTSGKKKRKILSASTREDAIQRMRDFKAALPPGLVSRPVLAIVPEEPVAENAMTYGDVQREYWDYWNTKKREDITKVNKETLFNVHILPVFEKMPMRQIKPQHIQSFLNNLATMDNGKVRSWNSMNKIYIVLKSVFIYAREMGYLSKLPTYGIELPECTVSDKDKKYFDRPILVEHLVDMHSNPKYYMMALVLLATGLRPEEFLVLRWSNINFIEKTLKITNAMSTKVNPDGDRGAKYFYEEGKTKNASSVRTIYMGDVLIKTLMDWQDYMIKNGIHKKAQAKGHEDYVFLNQNGDLFLYSSLVANYQKHLATNGIFKHRMNFYMFRHSYATYMNECGVAESIISAQMGHSLNVNGDKASITRSVYISNTKKGYEQAAQNYNQFLEDIIAEVHKQLKSAFIATQSLSVS